MHQMAVDIQQRRAILKHIHQMVVPNFFEQGAGRRCVGFYVNVRIRHFLKNLWIFSALIDQTRKIVDQPQVQNCSV
jgi:hypothetical protein